jgi:hypothetical protein
MPLGRRSPGSAHRRNRLRPGFITTLGAAHVLPTHSAVGDGSLVAKEKAFIVDLRTRGLELKKQGLDAEKAGGLLTGPKGPKGHALQSAKLRSGWDRPVAGYRVRTKVCDVAQRSGIGVPMHVLRTCPSDLSFGPLSRPSISTQGGKRRGLVEL